MGWSSSPLNSRVRVQVKVVLERVSYVALDQDSGIGISILVTSDRTGLWEKANVMALGSNDHSVLDLFSFSVSSLVYFDVYHTDLARIVTFGAVVQHMPDML